MSDHKFPIEVAKDFDVETALLLEFMRFITLYNKSNKHHLHDGSVWVYNSYEAWTQQFPYWTAKQMRRILANAEENGLLRVGNYNKRESDLTKWYALTDKAIEYFSELKEQEKTTSAQTGKTPAQTGKTPAQTGSALPDTKPDTNTDKNTTTTNSSSSFDNEVLNLKLKSDNRTDLEFLENVNHHIRNNSDTSKPIYQRQRMVLKLLRKLKDANHPFQSTGFISSENKEKIVQESIIRKRIQQYSEYVSCIKRDIDFKIIPKDTKILSFEEWNNAQLQS